MKNNKNSREYRDACILENRRVRIGETEFLPEDVHDRIRLISTVPDISRNREVLGELNQAFGVILDPALHHDDACAEKSKSTDTFIFTVDRLSERQKGRLESLDGNTVVTDQTHASSKDWEAVFRKRMEQLQTNQWSAVAFMLGGRQTFCNLGGQWALHPEFETEGNILNPKDIRTEIFFLQSCHSPYVWDDLGGQYDSLPISIARSTGKPVIASKRVQWPMPEAICGALA